MSDAQDAGQSQGQPAPQGGHDTTLAPPGGQGAGRTWERSQRAIEALVAARAKAEAEQPAPDAEPAGEPAQAAPETTAPAAPSADKSPDLVELEAKLARALAGAQKYERETHEQKRVRETLEAEIRGIKEREAKLRANPLELLREYGVDYAQLTKDILAGKFQPPKAEDIEREKATGEQRKMLERLEALEREKQEAVREQTRTKEVEFATNRIKERADSLPVLSSLGWTPGRAVEQFYAVAEKQGSAPDFDALLSDLENAASADVRSVLGNERAVKALLAGDKALRDTVVKALGLTAKQQSASPASETRAPSAGNGPRTITTEDAAAPSSITRRAGSDEERKRAALSALAALRSRSA